MKAFGKGFMGCLGVGVAIVVVIIVIAAASNKSGVVTSGTTGGASTSGSKAKATAAATAHVGTAITLDTSGSGSVSITLAQIIDPAQGADQFTVADSGKRFVGVKFAVKNAGSQSETDDVNTDVTVIGSDNQSYTPDFDSIAACTNFSSGTYTLAAGESATGCAVFQLPTGVNTAKVQYKPGAGFSDQTGEWLVP